MRVRAPWRFTYHTGPAAEVFLPISVTRGRSRYTPDTPGIERVKGIGFCSPTYFIFQMRIDNHTTPW